MNEETIQDLFKFYQQASRSILNNKGAAAATYLQKALRILEGTGRKLDPNFYITMLFPWADLFWSLERPDMVLEVFDLIDQELPGDPQISLHRAIALFHLARFDEAQNLLSDLEDRGYPAADLHFFLGCLAERMGRDATAMANFKRAATLEPERYTAPIHRDEKAVRDTMKRIISRMSGPLKASLNHTRLIFEPLPSDRMLSEAQPRLDPLALTKLDLERSRKKRDTPQISAIRLFMKNIEKAGPENEDMEERLGDSLAHELSEAMQLDEDELRNMVNPPID